MKKELLEIIDIINSSKDTMFKASVPASHRPTGATPKKRLYEMVDDRLSLIRIMLQDLVKDVIKEEREIDIPDELPWSHKLEEESDIDIVKGNIFECQVLGPKEPSGARPIFYQGPRDTGEKIYRILKANW